MDSTQQHTAQVVANANHSEVHRQTGISLSGVNRILHGKRNATSANLAKIAGCLGVSMDDLHRYLTALKMRPRGRPRRTGVAA